MKIVSNLLSQLGKATDVQLRDITSNLDIAQETILILPEIPGPNDYWGPPTAAQVRTSFGISRADLLTNGAALTFTFCLLTRGLWKFNISGSYNPGAVPVSFVATAGMTVNLRSPAPNNVDVPLVWILPDASAITKVFDRTMYVLLTEDGWQLNAGLGAAAVAQTHGYGISILGSKFL